MVTYVYVYVCLNIQDKKPFDGGLANRNCGEPSEEFSSESCRPPFLRTVSCDDDIPNCVAIFVIVDNFLLSLSLVRDTVALYTFETESIQMYQIRIKYRFIDLIRFYFSEVAFNAHFN
jgi:hypothetical protein